MRKSCELARTAVKMLMTENGNMEIVRMSSILTNGRGDTISASQGDKAFQSTKTGNDSSKPSTKNAGTTSAKPSMIVIKKTVELDKGSLSSATKDSKKMSNKSLHTIDVKKDTTLSIDSINSDKDKKALPVSKPNMNPPTSTGVLPESMIDSDNSKVPTIMDITPLKSEIVTSQKLPVENSNEDSVTYVPVTGYERLNYVATCLPKTVIVKKIPPIPPKAPEPVKTPEIVKPPVPKKPDEPKPPDSSSDSRSPFGFLFRIITLAVKLAILGGAVCWTQSEGVWGDGERSEKCLRRWAGSVQEQPCACMPKTETEAVYPTMDEITNKVVDSYNSVVAYCIYKISSIGGTGNCPCGCGASSQCGNHSPGDEE